MIISASRRTDMPTFYGEWFINRIKEGFVYVRNPFNYHGVSKIALTPDLVDIIVFWTKDAWNFMDKLAILDDMEFKYYFHFTINPYDNGIERRLRAKNDIIKNFIALSERIGEEKIIWRYDPIFLSDNLTVDYHIRQFGILCKKLAGFTHTVIISFLDEYRKVGSRRPVFRKPSLDEMLIIGDAFSQIAQENKLRIKTCAEEIIFRNGIEKASCIDAELISRILRQDIQAAKDKNQRKECLCVESIDVGEYDSCMHLCQYCYANCNDSKIIKNNGLHDTKSPLLIGNISETDIIKERKISSIKTAQLTIF